MAYQNIATTGATQNNIGLDIAFNRNIHYHIASVATAQQFGSPLRTKYSYNPLQELIQATNDGDIAVKRYHGDNIYREEIGRIITATGQTKEMMMEQITDQDGEHPTQLSTIIVCLSIYFDKRWLSPILASAIMLFTHKQMDKSMEGDIHVLQENIERYANAVLSRDGMCNKLENAKARARDLVKSKAPHIRDHTLFLPPRTPAEEGDFVEFIVELWSARVDGDKIYTRSAKLLALALILSEYGWQIDVFVETDGLEIISLKEDTTALSVIYSSSINSKAREYVENHNRYVRISRNLHSTASCVASQIGEVTSRSLSEREGYRQSFIAGYNSVSRFCDAAVEFRLEILDSGKIRLGIEYTNPSPATAFTFCCWGPVSRFVPRKMSMKFKKLVVLALHDAFPDSHDWYALDEELEGIDCAEIFTSLLSSPNGNMERLWNVTGATICALDKIMLGLINLPDESLVRIPVYESLKHYITDSARLLEDLLGSDDNDDDDDRRGLEPGRAVELCATRLAGLEPGNHRIPPNFYSILGYWNAQQGILLTPVLERTLYVDLPLRKRRPLTFFNTPIVGMPTDDDWIRAGTVDAAVARPKHAFQSFPERRRHHNHYSQQSSSSSVAMEYRPNFERDSSTVVAAAYIDGVFSHLLPLSGLMSRQWCTQSRCRRQCRQQQHQQQQPQPQEHQHPSHHHDGNELRMARRPFLQQQPFSAFEPGEIAVPPAIGYAVVIGPQINTVSRFFSSLVYRQRKPVIQSGCWDCALRDAGGAGSSIIIPKPEAPPWAAKAARKRMGADTRAE
ncbi:hypothetical protein GGR52DRAFT_113911 [Hypoxylon sp. FL1284]|nr:hypothetical protein GGR52DRAFT_113911 [Hypoxylon sp. FL1284]